VTAVDELYTLGSEDRRFQQDLYIFEDAQSVIRCLYSIGFLGIRDTSSNYIVFCHDGRSPDRTLSVGDVVMVHPCYWIALNCSRDGLQPAEAEEIYDEYDIEVASESSDMRRQKIVALTSELDEIELGTEGDSEFEIWCHKAIRICFARSLRNVELKPNKQARQRRDVVGTNLGTSSAWARIREDYGTRQVVFEVKNYQNITASDYQQVLTYLTGEYGRLAFAITRDETVDLYSSRDVEWVRDLWSGHKVIVIKITGIWLRKHLHKLIDPKRHEDVDDSIHKLLDTYTRLYLSGETSPPPVGQKKLSRKKQRKLANTQAIGK
jgi:hypothetical protein